MVGVKVMEGGTQGSRRDCDPAPAPVVCITAVYPSTPEHTRPGSSHTVAKRTFGCSSTVLPGTIQQGCTPERRQALVEPCAPGLLCGFLQERNPNSSQDRWSLGCLQTLNPGGEGL